MQPNERHCSVAWQDILVGYRFIGENEAVRCTGYGRPAAEALTRYVVLSLATDLTIW